MTSTAASFPPAFPRASKVGVFVPAVTQSEGCAVVLLWACYTLQKRSHPTPAFSKESSVAGLSLTELGLFTPQGAMGSSGSELEEQGVYGVISSSFAFDTWILGSSFAVSFAIPWSC